MKAYKGFDKDLKCRDFQYEVGKEYETESAILCEKGFHACTNPLDVWDFYSPCDNNRFCEVEQSGDVEKNEKCSKVSSTKIKINAEIGIAGLVKAHIDFLKKSTINKVKSSIGESAIDKDYAKIGSSGYSAKIGSSGYYAQIGSSGDSAQIGSSGDSAKIGSSGDSAKIGSSGDYAKIGSSGDYAKIGSSGYSAKIGSSGDSAQIGSSGDSAKIDSTGKGVVIANIGQDGIVKAEEGSWVTIAEYEDPKQDDKGKWYRPCKCVKSFKVTAEQAGKWLMLKDGKIVEV